MIPEGPYVSVAAICESVLIEKDDRVTCVRFLDTLNIEVSADTPDPLPGIAMRISAFVAFKSGPFVGTKHCALRLNSPSGKIGKLSEESPRTYPMAFKGGEHGHNLTLTLEIPLSEGGLYWFDVLLDDVTYTRIPLKINITRKLAEKTDSESSMPIANVQA
jgi:hypothetical protein